MSLHPDSTRNNRVEVVTLHLMHTVHNVRALAIHSIAYIHGMQQLALVNQKTVIQQNVPKGNF